MRAFALLLTVLLALAGSAANAQESTFQSAGHHIREGARDFGIAVKDAAVDVWDAGKSAFQAGKRSLNSHLGSGSSEPEPPPPPPASAPPPAASTPPPKNQF